MTAFYLALSIIGIVVPYGFFVPWLMEHGLDIPLFVAELFSTRVGAFFGADVIVSAIVLFAFIFADGRRAGARALWAPVIGTLIVGVSLGLPLYLYLRERSRAST